MSEQEVQELLLHGSPAQLIKMQVTGGKTLYSVGFIFGFKLRQKLRTVNDLEMEVYISHLRIVSARECNGRNLTGAIARLCELYALKELKKTRRHLTNMLQERFERATPQQPASSKIWSRIRDELCP
jgi:hypothetical protein